MDCQFWSFLLYASCALCSPSHHPLSMLLQAPTQK